MKLQVLISTMDQEDFSLIEKMNLKSDAVVINQCNKNSEEVKISDANRILWINSYKRGLSRSRNMAINNADADICVLADDDLEYISGYDEFIKRQFEDNPKADIIVFQVEGIEEKFKSYKPKSRWLNKLTVMKVSSVEIAFRLSRIKENNIAFKEEFGAGSTHLMGEENIFLYECLNKGLGILYVPVKIADLHIGNSSWSVGFNEKYFVDRGAGYAAMGRLISILLIWQFGIRKYRLYKNKVSIFNALKKMHEGRKGYLDQQNQNEDE